MKSNKEHRFKNNPKEKEFYENFIEIFKPKHSDSLNTSLSAVIFGWENSNQSYPVDYLTHREESICVNLIQWLGSPVGQGFLNSCGFVLNNQKKANEKEISIKR